MFWCRSVDDTAASAPSASLVMVRGQGWFTPKPVQGDMTVEATWQCLPFDILQKVAGELEIQDLKAARQTCKAWKCGVSNSVQRIRPRMEANALGLQWCELGDIQKAFPAVKELDLRQMPPRPCHATFFSAFSSLQRIYLSSLQRSAEPRKLLSELWAFASALQASNSAAIIDLELRFGESSLLWGSSCASDADSDADIRSVSELPSNTQVTMLHMPQLCYAISASGLDSVMRLTNLRHLRLVTYGANITDAEFQCLRGLTRLEHLWFGVVPFVTDEGLLAGLGGLTQLRELFLYDVGSITDAGIDELSDRLTALEGLSLSKCHKLTNFGLESLAKLPLLSRLFLSENEHITCDGASRFPDGLKSLTVRQCPNVNRSDIHI